MNTLGQAKSLYLKQHKDNPVNWYSWSEDIFKIAKAENKPILLSSGYSACHWCHVMAHESFEDPETAALMNDHFVNVKLDREERPEIDHLYQQALSLMGEPGGWPLTLFLDTDGKPFFGGTYFPPKPMHGRPSFQTILKGIAGSWAKGEAAIAHNAAALMQGIKEESNVTSQKDVPSQSDVENAFLKLISGFDPKFGGFGSTPKFPQIPMLRAINHATQAISAPENKTLDMDVMRHIVTLSMDNICQGGIYDHVRGGVYRYATDQQWRVPHFEKMLCDNALFILALCDVYRRTQSRLYKERIEQTVTFMIEDMRSEDQHSFSAAIDADDADGEGTFYTFTEDEVNTAISSLSHPNAMIADDFKRIYGITDKGNWFERPGRNILNRTYHQELFAAHKEDDFKPILNALKKLQKNKPKPQRDDKVLTDWNAMAFYALCEAGVLLKREDWIDIAKQGFTALAENSLAHCHIDGEITAIGLIDDYAWMMLTALTLYEVTGDMTYLDQSQHWMTVALRDFYDEDKGGFFTSSKTATDIPQPIKTISDTSVPSSNAIMITAMQKLAAITKDEVLNKRVQTLLKCFASDLSNAPHAVGGYISNIISNAALVSVELQAPDFKEAQDWALKIKRHFGDQVTIAYKTAPSLAAIICHNGTCSAPLANLDAIITTVSDNLT